MDRRAVFLFVFAFTLFSTILVAGVSIASGQNAINTVLYSLATMWIVGMISQLLMKNLYQGIVKPLEEERVAQEKEAAREEVNLDGVEAIDEIAERLKDVEVPPAKAGMMEDSHFEQ